MTAASNSDARKREAERAQQAVRGQKSATGAPNSPEVAWDASGAVGAILSAEQRLRLCGCSLAQGYAADHRNCERRMDVFAAVVREHRAEVLAEVERVLDAYDERWKSFAPENRPAGALVRDVRAVLATTKKGHIR